MNKSKVAILVSAALVAGLVLGSVGIASAATATTTTGAGLGGIMRQAGGTLAEIVAKLTGKTTTEVYAERKDGKSFATIASENGVAATKVASEALAARKSALDAAVKAGTITQAQADLMASRMSTNIPARINSAAPANCDGTGSGAGRVGGGMMGGGRGAGAGFGRGGVCINQ